MGNKYPGVSVSGFDSVPPSDDGSIVDSNKVKWSVIKSKLATPIYNALNDMNTALVTYADESAQLKTAGYTTTLSDHKKLIEVTGSNTILLLDASTGGAGYEINILNTGVGVVICGRATAGNTINGVAGNWTLNPGNGASFRVNSTNNGYDVIGTALTDGSSLADVVHKTGNETVAGVKTFSSPVIGATATASTELVTKAQLDAKVYGGRIANGGAASVTYGPAGWTVSRSSIGVTVVTHNLNTLNYACSPVGGNNSINASITAIALNTFTVNTFVCNTAAMIDSDYNFVLARN